MSGVTFFVAAHRNPEQVARLLRVVHRQLRAEDRILFHFDPRGGPGPDVGAFDQLDVLAPRAVHWGGFSQIALSLAAMDSALREHDPSWLVFISGQDYPIKPITEITEELEGSGMDGFLATSPVDALSWDLGRGRYLYRYPAWAQVHVPEAIRPLLSLRLALINLRSGTPRVATVFEEGSVRIGFRRNPFDERFRCWHGASWWTLSGRAIAYVLDFVNRSPSYVDHFAAGRFAGDEAFFNTILANATTLRIETDNYLRYVRWQSRDAPGHPDTLRTEDLERILMSGAHFARKFDVGVDAEVLDLIDHRLHDSPGSTDSPVSGSPRRSP